MEPVDQDDHAVVLFVDDVARLLQGDELAFAADVDGRAADGLVSAVGGAVVAGEVRRDGDV